MTQLEQVQAAVDAFLDARFGAFVATLQRGHKSEYQRYWHGPWTHDAPPDVSTLGSSPGVTRARLGELSWQASGAAFMLPNDGEAPMRARVSMDAYLGPLGDGYVLRAQVADGDAWYETARASGPHAGDWPVGQWIRADEEA